MTHVRISPYCPQSSCKIERWHKTLKGDAIRVLPPSSLAEARLLVECFSTHLDGMRLRSALKYVTPKPFSRPTPRPSGPSATRSSKLRKKTGTSATKTLH